MAGRHSGVKSQPRKLKGPGAFMPPAHAISTKNKHLLLSCDTNPRFHGGSFGVLGTPPPKPLDCKIRLNSRGALRCGRPRKHSGSGGKPRFSSAALLLLPG